MGGFDSFVEGITISVAGAGMSSLVKFRSNVANFPKSILLNRWEETRLEICGRVDTLSYVPNIEETASRGAESDGWF